MNLDLTQYGAGVLVLPALLTAVIAYFCGCFNGAVIVSKYILHDDVRGHGSGNAGLTNFYRTFGGPLTVVVILTDVLKAVVALLAGAALARSMVADTEALGVLGKYWAGVFCLLGHMFPCVFHFKGGKGILSGGTIVWMLDWRIAVLVWGSFLILAILTRYVSLGSISTGILFPVGTWFVYGEPLLLVLSIIIGGLIVWKHRGNIRRLLAGNESKFTLHRKKEDGT